MKKEIINGVITILFMSVITILSILMISLCAYGWKWQSHVAMQGITYTYIVTGLAGGLLQGLLFRRTATNKIGILRALL